MQRQDSTRPCKSSDGEPSLDVALAKPADDERFYTASVHFLRKRLQEKNDAVPREVTQSCCNLATLAPALATDIRRQQSVAHFCLDTPKLNSTELPMYQVLPFPKSNKDSLISRIKKKFRKFRQHLDVSDATADEDTKKISNFKFPRCERPCASTSPRRSRRLRRPLGGISEDQELSGDSDGCSSAKTTGIE